MKARLSAMLHFGRSETPSKGKDLSRPGAAVNAARIVVLRTPGLSWNEITSLARNGDQQGDGSAIGF
jgi:hypothetical protein